MDAVRPISKTVPSPQARPPKQAPATPPDPVPDRVEVNRLLPLETPKSAVDKLAVGYGYVEFPQISPDGATIVFNVVHDYDTSQMLAMDDDGRKVRSLFTGETVSPDNVKAFLGRYKGHIDEQGTFSEDGRTIWYRSNEKGTFGIARFDVRSTAHNLVVHDPALNIKHPVETADGYIVGYGGPPSKKYKTSEDFSDIILADPKDGTWHRITHSDGTVAYKHPSVLNGRVIAHKEPRGGAIENGDLVEIDPQTGAERNLTKTPDASEKHPFFNDRVNLLTFHSDEAGDKNIWLATPDGRRRAPITFYGQAAQSPCWSHDGRKIYFVKKLEKQAEGEPFFARQADIRVIDVPRALKSLKKQAKERLKELEARKADDALVEQARESYETYRYFLERYD